MVWYVAGWMIITDSSFLSCSSFIYKGIVQCFFSIGKYTRMFDVIISNEPKGTWKKQYQVIISTTTNEWNLDAVTYDENHLSNLYGLHIIISIKLHRDKVLSEWNYKLDAFDYFSIAFIDSFVECVPISSLMQNFKQNDFPLKWK